MSRTGSGRWQPPKELVALRDRLSELFEAGGGTGSDKNDATEAAMRWTPPLDVISSEDRIMVSLEVPGLRAVDLSAILEHGQVLTIRGERERRLDGITHHRIERPKGPFDRAVTLPGPVDPERVEISLALGVLTLSFHRVAEPSGGSRTFRIS